MSTIDLLSEKQMDMLAAKIARQQLTAADSYIEEVVASWPEHYQKKVMPIGHKNMTSQQRYEAFRLQKIEIEREIAKDEAEKQKFQAELEKRRADRAAKEASHLEQEQLRYKAQLAQHELAVHQAKAHGQPAPPAPREPMTLTEVEALQRGQSYRM